MPIHSGSGTTVDAFIVGWHVEWELVLPRLCLDRYCRALNLNARIEIAIAAIPLRDMNIY